MRYRSGGRAARAFSHLIRRSRGVAIRQGTGRYRSPEGPRRQADARSRLSPLRGAVAMHSTLSDVRANPYGKRSATLHLCEAPRSWASRRSPGDVLICLLGMSVGYTCARAPPVFDATPYNLGAAGAGSLAVWAGRAYQMPHVNLKDRRIGIEMTGKAKAPTVYAVPIISVGAASRWAERINQRKEPKMRFFSETARASCTFACMVAYLLTGPVAAGAPGDTVVVIPVPVPSPSGVGVSIEADCEAPPTLYYTNTGIAFLYSMDAYGNDLGAVPITDAVTGKIVTLGAISWDDVRKVLWGGTDGAGSPVSVYQIDPETGIATFAFTAETPGVGFTDGIYYDVTDDTIYVSDDISTEIDQHAASTGAHIRTFTPTDAAGEPLGLISGVIGGAGDVLYLGRNGLGLITQVKKSTGSFIGQFASPGGRNADMACDGVSFAPLTVIWSKDAYNDTITAIEAERGTCQCGRMVPIPTVSEWGVVIMMLLLLTAGKVYFGSRRPARI